MWQVKYLALIISLVSYAKKAASSPALKHDRTGERVIIFGHMQALEMEMFLQACYSILCHKQKRLFFYGPKINDDI